MSLISLCFMLSFLASVVTQAETQQILIKDMPGAIYVDIRGYPRPDFVWRKDNAVLNITATDRYKVAPNGTLLMANVESGDGGIYALTAELDFSLARSGNINVTLYG